MLLIQNKVYLVPCLNVWRKARFLKSINKNVVLIQYQKNAEFDRVMRYTLKEVKI